MELPTEVLEKIVELGLDSCQTFISWAQISGYFRDFIKAQVGIVLVQDGHDGPGVKTFPLDYNTLITNSNNFILNTDELLTFDEDLFRAFLKKFGNYLIIIQSDRSYSDAIAAILGYIGHDTPEGANINVIYNTSVDFLSKLYFRELALYRTCINLRELHILGNSLPIEQGMCDVDTLFQTTYIYNLKSIYSLDIKNPEHTLIAPGLSVIRQISCTDPNINLFDYLAKCPKLKIIGSTNFPIPSEQLTYKLPHCKYIGLNGFNSGVTYPPIDGSEVLEEITLSPSLRAIDPKFCNLFFPHIRRLNLKWNTASNSLVKFQSCDFPHLEYFNSRNSITPWSDLIDSGATIKTLQLNLLRSDQLEWLLACPYEIDTLYITKVDAKNSDFVIDPVFQNTCFSCPNMIIDIENLWQCYLLQTFLIPNLRTSSSLSIKVNEAKLIEIINTTTKSLQSLGLVHEDNCIICKLPPLKSLTLTCLSNIYERSVMMDELKRSSSTSSSVSSTTMAYRNILEGAAAIDSALTGGSHYSVSPSEFRRNSLAGFDDNTARRQSIITFSHPTGLQPNRRRSSATSPTSPTISGQFNIDDTIIDDVILFELPIDSPYTLTLNLALLESSLLSTKNLEERTFPCLRILLDNSVIDSNFTTTESLLRLLALEVIRTISYSYDLKLASRNQN